MMINKKYFQLWALLMTVKRKVNKKPGSIVYLVPALDTMITESYGSIMVM